MKPKKAKIGLEMPLELYYKLKALAVANNGNISKTIRLLIEQATKGE